MAKKPFTNEQEYGRFVPPVLDDEVDKTREQAEIEFDDVEETEDGGAVIVINEEEEVQTDFYDNLAETLPDDVLASIATELVELVEKDSKAREKRDKQYEEGIKRTGLGNDAPGGATFSGASKVVHPLMAEACVDFASRAIKELFPPSGPVRTKIVGKATREKTERADRKRDYMNWQLTTQISSYRSELEQLLTQLPLGGGQYLKFWHDPVTNKPDCEFVPIDNIYLPFSCSNFYNSPRITHAQDITQYEFDKRIRTGLYKDIRSAKSSIEPDQTASEEATDKVEGKESSGENEDGLRRVYEIRVMRSIEEDDITGGDTAPYLISIDKDTDKVLSIYRNWEEDDATFENLDWIVEFPFIPWRGAYPIGLPQLIGGLSGALTGALRALLDTAHINNSPSLIKLKSKGGRSMGGQDTTIDPTEVSEIEGPVGADDVRKLIMPVPYNPPSTVLFQLLDWLTTQAKGVVSTASEKIADATNAMPVGTALALIEQGSITYSAIHSRLHHSQAKALAILNRLNRQYLDEEQVIEDLGGTVIRRKDFEESLDVIPVSDPNIFSEAQRYAQIQAVLQLETVSKPGTFNDYEVRRRALSLMHIDDIDELLPPPPTPKEMNAVAENVAITYGQPLAAFPDQDHLAHIEAHLTFITDPNLGGNPLFSQALNPMMNHVKQHITMFYAEAVNNALNQGGADFSSQDKREQDNAVAVANLMAQEAIGKLFENFKEVFAQAMQMSQKQAEAQQADIQDPSAKAMLIAAKEETKRKAADDERRAKLAETELVQKVKKEAADQQEAQQARIEQLQKEMADLQLKARAEESKAMADSENRALKDKEIMLKHSIEKQKLQQAVQEFKREMWEWTQEHQAKLMQMALDQGNEEAAHALRVRQADLQAFESRAMEAESRTLEATEEEITETNQYEELKEMTKQVLAMAHSLAEESRNTRTALDSVAEKSSKPKNVVILRGRDGRAIGLRQE